MEVVSCCKPMMFLMFFCVKQVELPKLHDDVNNEKASREEIDESIMKKTSEELIKLTNVIQQEKKDREESEQSIFDMLKEVVHRVKTEIEGEKKNR